MRIVLKKRKLPDNMYDYRALMLMFVLFVLSGFLGVALYDSLVIRIIITIIVLCLLIVNKNKFMDALGRLKGDGLDEQRKVKED